jgi:hypothetical protein
MPSLNRVHAANTRSILEHAFHLSWADVQARDPFRDFSDDETLKGSLRRKLFAMASSGMRDPELMRQTISATLSIKHDANEEGRR